MTGQILSHDDIFIVTQALGHFGARLQSNVRSEFGETGYKIFRIPEQAAEQMQGLLADSISRPFSGDDCLPNYISSNLDEATVAKLNAKHIYYGFAPAPAASAFTEYMTSIALPVERELGHRWKIVNVRAWKTLPAEETDFGPTEWHCDGMSSFANKFMLYLLPMNDENGTLELYDRHGTKHTLKTSYPACVLFDNGVLTHRGRSGKQPRLAIEVQTIPAAENKTEYIYAGQNARIPRDYAPEIEAEVRASHYKPKPPRKLIVEGWKKFIPLSLKQTIKDMIYPRPDPVEQGIFKMVPNYAAFLNIGGGLNFAPPSWINLEVETGPKQPFSFRLTPTCTFPARTGSIQKIYSSHCFEHLDDATVARSLAEARRVLSKNGKMIIVFPDFEKVIERWRANDAEFFKIWGIESIAYTWPRKGIPDNIKTRASFIFCGWMNQAWGDHFGDNIRRDEATAYHGPIDTDLRVGLHWLLENRSPHQIVQALCEIGPDNDFYAFNHQNAWSRKEFCALLDQSGFRVVSTDAKTIIDGNQDIPDIGVAVNISAYYEAVLK